MRLSVMTFLLAISGTAWAQAPQVQSRPSFPLPLDAFASNKPSDAPTSSQDYRIGSNDFLVVEVYGEPNLTSPGRVSASGTITLQLLGPFDTVGLTTLELEKKVEAALRDRKLINDPHVTVTVQEYASQPVQVLGAVKSPNVYQLKGEKNLFAMIAVAGGLDANVGGTIQVMRGALKSGASTGTGPTGTSNADVLTVDVDDFQTTRIGLDIPIYANDAIYVSSAGSVFVTGEFIHPDEFVLRNGKNLTVIQALGKAGGTTRDAKKKGAVLIRIHEDGKREDIALDLDRMLKGEVPDVAMVPNDILYMPANKAKAALNRSLEGAISVVTGRLIYRF